MNIYEYFQLHIICVIITFLIRVNLYKIKRIKSDVADFIVDCRQIDINSEMGVSILGPIALIGILTDLFIFWFIQTKESYDTGVIKILINKHGKNETRRMFEQYYEVLPSHFENILDN
jgi:hypothetical protein